MSSFVATAHPAGGGSCPTLAAAISSLLSLLVFLSSLWCRGLGFPSRGPGTSSASFPVHSAGAARSPGRAVAFRGRSRPLLLPPVLPLPVAIFVPPPPILLFPPVPGVAGAATVPLVSRARALLVGAAGTVRVAMAGLLGRFAPVP